MDVKKGVARANSGCLIAALTYLPLLLTWAFSLVDILARRDLSMRGKGAWLLAVVFLPPFGLAGYLATRPSSEARASPSRELALLMRLRREGRITTDEYERMRLRFGEAE